MNKDSIEGSDVGQPIRGTGIPEGARITSVTSTSASFRVGRPARIWKINGPGAMSIVDYVLGVIAGLLVAGDPHPHQVFVIGCGFVGGTIGGRLGVLITRKLRMRGHR